MMYRHPENYVHDIPCARGEGALYSLCPEPTSDTVVLTHTFYFTCSYIFEQVKDVYQPCTTILIWAKVCTFFSSLSMTVFDNSDSVGQCQWEGGKI